MFPLIWYAAGLVLSPLAFIRYRALGMTVKLSLIMAIISVGMGPLGFPFAWFLTRGHGWRA